MLNSQSHPFRKSSFILVTNHFISNQAYFSIYIKHCHKFQTGSREILVAYKYNEDVDLQLIHSDSFQII